MYRMPACAVAVKSSRLSNYWKLDDSRRQADLSKLSGFFGVAKDADCDRLVVDARPPNAYEDSLAYWTYTMASAASLCGIELGQSEVASIWSVDLIGYCYEFIVSAARERRNMFRGIWPSEAFVGFLAAESLPSETEFCLVALATMAMGDANAAEFGQCTSLLGFPVWGDPPARACLPELPSPEDSILGWHHPG